MKIRLSTGPALIYNMGPSRQNIAMTLKRVRILGNFTFRARWPFSFLLIGTLLSLLINPGAFAKKTREDEKPVSVQAVTKATYLSSDDSELFIKKILVEVPKDNVGGIYSQPLEKALTDLVDKSRIWNLQNVKAKKSSADGIESSVIESPRDIDFQEDNIQIQKKLSENDAEGLMQLRIAKTDRGISLWLGLYTKANGDLLINESIHNLSKFHIDGVREEVERLYKKLLIRLPFKGFVLSRQNRQITFNVGKSSGLKIGDTVDLVQIVKVHRHPKLRFMVGVEKEIIGRAKIFKAEEFLSFGKIIFEKEPGVVQVGNKVWTSGFIYYTDPLYDDKGGEITSDLGAEGSEKFFGKNPDEWLPLEKPQYGQISLSGGIGQYMTNGSLIETGTYSKSNPLTPALKFQGDLWINSTWGVGFTTFQSVFGIKNPVADSSPSNLMMSVSQYQIYGGYNLLVNEDFFGPKVQFQFGANSTQFRPDMGDPIALTEMSFNGNFLGFRGLFQVSSNLPLEIGLSYRYFLTKSLSENPSSGSGAVPTLSSMGFQFYYRSNVRLKWVGEYEVNYYSSTFTGIGTRGSNSATQISHKLQNLLFGAEIAF